MDYGPVVMNNAPVHRSFGLPDRSDDFPGQVSNHYLTKYNGRTMNFQAVMNGAGNEHVHITRLLGDTQPIRWQESLKKLIMTYYQDRTAKQAVAFLTDNIDRAINAVQNPQSSPGFPAIFIDTRHKPTIFDIDCWKFILIGLNFEITEPEGNRHLDLLEVRVTDKVTLPSLIGFQLVLQSLSALEWDNLRMIMYLEKQEGYDFLCVLQDLLRTHSRISNQNIVCRLYERYKPSMDSLGFFKQKTDRKSRRSEVLWDKPESDQLYHYEVALFGLFHHGKGLETYV